ncbi:hypothetical protein ACTWQL_01695 [Pseudalkalibacillus sp. R45]|uniref:hypothetical protein n=1 Tax=Pseudalkalibacillus sp. R45 TaxID=3457433 RepID=UPI003FCE6E53
MVSPVPLIPQDKESFSSVTSHEENAIFIFEESRTLLSNQLAQGDFLKMTQKQQSVRKEQKPLADQWFPYTFYQAGEKTPSSRKGKGIAQ